MKEILRNYDLFITASLGKRTENMVVITILLIFTVIRLFTINNPDIDQTQWKELDYIAIAQGYIDNGFAFHKPTIWWPADPPRITAMEFPIVPYFAGILIHIFGYHPITIRILTLISFLFLGFYTYKLVRKIYGPLPAILVLVISLTMPFNFQVGTILYSEPLLITASVICIYYFKLWSEEQSRKKLLIGLSFFSLCLLLKPTSLYLLIPITYLLYTNFKLAIGKYMKILPFFMISIIPAVLWYAYAIHLTKTSIDVFGVAHGHDKFQTITMLTSKGWYYSMISRFKDLFFGFTGLILMLVGILNPYSIKKGRLFYFYLLALLCFLVIVAEGHLDAPYRQYTFIPVASFFIVSGSFSIISIIYGLYLRIAKARRASQDFKSHIFYTLFVLFILFFTATSLYKFTKQPAPNGHRKILAEEIIKYKTGNSKMITLGAYSIHKGGNDLSPVLYHYSGVRGWAFQKDDWSIESVQSKIDEGADLLAAIHIDREKELRAFVEELKEEYPILFESETEQLLLLSLKP